MPDSPPGGERQPSANLDGPRGQRRIERRRVLLARVAEPFGRPAARGAGTRCARASPRSRGDVGRQPRLAIERPQHRLEVRHDGLDLDDEERSGRWVEGEDVDRAAFAADVERHLGGDLPPDGIGGGRASARRGRHGAPSSRRSRPSPCHSSRTVTVPPSAAATRTRTCTVTRSARPRSMRPTTPPTRAP